MLKVCEICGKDFDTQKIDKLCCSKKCTQKRYRMTHRKEPKKKEIGKCAICGSEFEKFRENHLCCSEKCRKVMESRKSGERMREYKKRKKEKEIREAVKITKKGENHRAIADIAIAARKEGLTYGQYVAKYMGVEK